MLSKQLAERLLFLFTLCKLCLIGWELSWSIVRICTLETNGVAWLLPLSVAVIGLLAQIWTFLIKFPAFVYTNILLNKRTHTRMHIHTHAHTHVHTYTKCAHTYTHTHAHTHPHPHPPTHTHTHTHTQPWS